MAELRALTLWRPWPALILHAGKNVENRGWSTGYRGRLLLHAGKRWDGSRTGVRYAPNVSPDPADHPTGIVGAVTLAGVCTAAMRGERCDCGFWAMPGECHWRLTDPVAFAEPVPCSGAQQLWAPPPEVLASVGVQLVAVKEESRG